MKPPVFFIIVIILLTSSTLQASAGISEITDDIRDKMISEFVKTLLSQKCWDGNWNVADKQGTSKAPIISNRHIRAYVDIVGFREEAVINGTHYINGSAKHFAIVKRKAWHTPVNGNKVSFRTKYAIFDHNGTTTAITTTWFHWKYKVKTLLGSRWVHVHEGPLRVTTTVPSPERFTGRLQNVTAKIRVHNRSVNPVAYLTIPSMENLTMVKVTYNESMIARHDQLGRVIQNRKGTELVEFTREDLPTWIKDKGQSVIDHQGRDITIFGDNFNASLLDVVLVSPYETLTVTDYEITEVDDRVHIPVPLLKVVAFGVIGAALIYMVAGVLIRAL